MVVCINYPLRICRKGKSVGNRGLLKRQDAATQYTERQIKKVLKSIEVSIVSETGNDFLCLCPIHGNKNTPSLSVSKTTGLYLCFNPSCGESGSLQELVKRVTKRNEFESLRLISRCVADSLQDFEEQIVEILEEKPEYVEFDSHILDKLWKEMSEHPNGRDYMHARGFNDETIRYFQVGYSHNQEMVTVPVHSPDGIPLGVVGRSVKEKKFKNSTGLPKTKTLFNVHRAKRLSSTVIVTEASFDAMRIHQAGYPNVVATLGGHLSPTNYDILNRYFTKIIIATDFDDKATHNGKNPGRDLGKSIAYKLKNKDIMWASYDYKVVYPHGAKDIGDMTDAEIKQCIENAVPNYEYSSWEIY